MENWAGVLTEVYNLQFEKLKKKIMLNGGQTKKKCMRLRAEGAQNF